MRGPAALADWARRRQVPVLTLLVVAGSVLCLYLALTKPSPDDGAGTPPSTAGHRYLPARLPGAAGPALVAATSVVPLTRTFDYQQLPYDVRVAVAGMTPSYAARFKTTFYGSLSQLARSARAVGTSSVLAAGVVSVTDASHVTCLVYVDQDVKEASPLKGQSAQQVFTYREVVKVVRVDGTWKVDGITTV